MGGFPTIAVNTVTTTVRTRGAPPAADSNFPSRPFQECQHIPLDMDDTATKTLKENLTSSGALKLCSLNSHTDLTSKEAPGSRCRQ